MFLQVTVCSDTLELLLELLQSKTLSAPFFGRYLDRCFWICELPGMSCPLALAMYIIILPCTLALHFALHSCFVNLPCHILTCSLTLLRILPFHPALRSYHIILRIPS